MSNLFKETDSYNQDISSWDVSNVTSMDYMFGNASSFNQSIGSWNVSQVTNMESMLLNGSNFNQDLSSWNVVNVTNMYSMFSGASSFNQDLSSWDVTNVNNMSRMFRNTVSFNKDISSWNVSNVNDMSFMFAYASSFDKNIGDWNISNVNIINGMFEEITLSTENYEGILNGWASLGSLQNNMNFDGGNSQYCDASGRDILTNTYNWTISDGTQECILTDDNIHLAVNTWILDPSFAEPVYGGHISEWDVSLVTNMSELFKDKTTFNSDICAWDVSNVTTMNNMFQSVTLSTANYDSLLLGWDALALQSGVSFHAGNSIFTN
jgi:surface protein